MSTFTIKEIIEFFVEDWGGRVTAKNEVTFGGQGYGGCFSLRKVKGQIMAFGQIEGDSDDCCNFDHFMELHGVEFDDDFIMVNYEWLDD